MDDLVHQGKILYWGTSMWDYRKLKQAHRFAHSRHLYSPIVEQPPYNLLERWIEKRLLPTARRLGMGIVVWSPLAGGALTGKYNQCVPAESRGASSSDHMQRYLNEGSLKRIRRFSVLAETLGVEPCQLALAWLLKQDGVSSVITGATHPEQLAANLGAIELTLSSTTMSEVDSLFRA